MFVDVAEIRKSPGQTFHFDFIEKIEPITVGSDEFTFPEPLNISLNIKNNGNVLMFSGKLIGDALLKCNRCVEIFTFHLDSVFEERYCHQSNVPNLIEEGQDPDEMHIFESDRIDLQEFIQENIVLDIPMKSVCDENCKGLCTVCGTNLNEDNCDCQKENIDPRLEELKKFFDR